MERALVADLRCPYCRGAFQVSSEAQGDAERIRYGLLKCRCFEFPIVDGVLLLSLASGHGGAQELLTPYVPLQVAAIQFLQKKDVGSLLGWMRRHMPLVTELLEGASEQTYIAYCARQWELQVRHVEQYLHDAARHEVVGYPNDNGVLARLRRVVSATKRELRREFVPAAPRRRDELDRLRDYYPVRFYSPRVNALALRLAQLPWGDRVLSLCCGHGVFENLLPALGLNADIVCVDGQFVNLLLTRKYTCPNGSFIVHDLQFPLPFGDGAFDGVFSSTCLPEIPAQKTFVEQAIRVTASSGWTFFDFIWNLDSGAIRVNGMRSYRFCQNFFERMEDYVDFFRECAGTDRRVGIDIPRDTTEYRSRESWLFERADIETELRAAGTPEISALVVDTEHFPGFVGSRQIGIATADRLSVSPVYALVSRQGDEIRYERRPQFAKFDIVMASKRFGGYPERHALPLSMLDDREFLFEQFCAGNLVFLPKGFDRETTSLAALRSAVGSHS